MLDQSPDLGHAGLEFCGVLKVIFRAQRGIKARAFPACPSFPVFDAGGVVQVDLAAGA